MTLYSVKSTWRTHMPFLVDIGDGPQMFFSRKMVEEPSFWNMVYVPFSIDGSIDVENAAPVLTGLPDNFNKCSPVLYRRATDGQVVLTFVAGSPETKYSIYRMIGPSISSLSEPEKLNPMGLRPWTACENNTYRIVGGVHGEDVSGDGEIHVLEFESGQITAIQNPFTWVYRIATDPSDDAKAFICGQLSENSRDIVTIAYDLAKRKVLGLLEVNGKSVYKPCVSGSVVAYAVRAGDGIDDRYLEWSDEFSIRPMEGVRSPTITADNGEKVIVRAEDFKDRPPMLDQRCHWKMRGKWFCTKTQTSIDADVCRGCGMFDSAPPFHHEVKTVQLAHMVAAVTLDKLTTGRPLQNVVERGVVPPSTISFIENPFFESETCKSGMFCSACRAEGQEGVAFRSQVAARWGLPENFMCPYDVEGCEYRGAVLSVEQKACCGGKVKTITTYACSAGLNAGSVTVDDCIACPIRNRRVSSNVEKRASANESPWSDPARRLI